MTKQTNKLEKLEAVRGFAAIYVVLNHIVPRYIFIGKINIAWAFRFGLEAVILFFLLSGFVIQYAYHLSTNKSFKLFFFKRFLRIFIPLIIVFVTNFLLLCVEAKGLASINWKALIGNIFMLQDLSICKPNVICDPLFGNGPLWSLSYEWWFYMLFFVIVNTVKEKTSAIVYIIGTISACTYLIYPNFINRELMYLIIWWVGGDMAKLFFNKKEITFNVMKIPLFVLFLNTLILFINLRLHYNKDQSNAFSPFLEFRNFGVTFIFVILAIAWKKMNWIGFKSTIGLFEKISPISYCIYISHWFLIYTATYLNFIANIYLRTILYVIVCFLFSYVVERIIYIKMNKWIMEKLKLTKPLNI